VPASDPLAQGSLRPAEAVGSAGGSAVVGAAARQHAQDHALALRGVAAEAHAPVADPQAQLVGAGELTHLGAGIVSGESRSLSARRVPVTADGGWLTAGRACA